MNRPKNYIELIALGEPFRLLFPLGTLIGLFGVLLWPLFLWKVTTVYPGVAHPRIMIEGFLTCFVIGFLGTALPRMLDAPRMTLAETLGFSVSLVATVCLHYTGNTLPGDLLFFFTLVSLGIGLVIRAVFRKDNPPPAFVLVAMGLLCGLTGSGIQWVAQIAPDLLPGAAVTIGRLLLNQGYLLLPIMGVGAFLLPRFFSLPSRQSFPESLTLTPEWKRRAIFAFLCGLGVIGSFALEAAGYPRTAFTLRAVSLVIYFLREVPFHKAGFGGGSLALGLRIALCSIPFGFALMAAWPARSFSFLHVVFITGFSLIAFIVASRVILGHSGQSDRFRKLLLPVLGLAACVTLAMLTRVSADWMPIRQLSHYVYAALSWITGVIIWALFILPGVRLEDEER